MNAVERWRQMVLREHEQSDSMRPEPRPDDHWTPYARQFKADPHRTDDPLLDYLAEQTGPEDTLIDVGAGGGRLALPLALRCRLVVAVEPSPSMCAVLRETAEEYGVGNVEVVEADWLSAEVEPGDVALCSHVLYVVQEIEAFVRKLEASVRKRVLVVLYRAAPQSQTYPLWEQVHGTPRLALPSLPQFEEVLAELGIDAAIDRLPEQPPRGFDSVEDAVAQLTSRMYVAPGSPAEERLHAVLPGMLEKKDGVHYIRGTEPVTPCVVSWSPA